jgi:hypothetical protein
MASAPNGCTICARYVEVRHVVAHEVAKNKEITAALQKRQNQRRFSMQGLHDGELHLQHIDDLHMFSHKIWQDHVNSNNSHDMTVEARQG